MTEQLIAEIQRKMLPYLNNEQLMHLRDAMAETLEGATITYDAVAQFQQKKQMQSKHLSRQNGSKAAQRKP